MLLSDQMGFPATLVNLFRRPLAQVVLPALPMVGDIVTVRDFDYEVIRREWNILDDGFAAITVMVQPQIDENGERPFRYPDEEGA